jgi:hypothetical protein
MLIRTFRIAQCRKPRLASKAIKHGLRPRGRTSHQLEAVAKAQAGGAGPVALTTHGGEVVDVFAHQNEAVESGRQILRVASYDSMLARVRLRTQGFPLLVSFRLGTKIERFAASA